MWKVWKKEIIGISAAALAIICMVAAFTLYMDRSGIGKEALYSPHVMVDGVIYWDTGDFIATLPDGYTECAVVKETINSRLRAEQDGQAVFFSEGRKIYRNPEQPGQVYLAQAYNRFHRLIIKDLFGSFLRYNGELYLSKSSIPYELDDGSITFNPKHFSPTGETVSWPGGGVVIPIEECTTNSSTYSGGEVCLNPEQPELLIVKRTIPTHTKAADTRTDYHVFVTAASLGLDYSAYEWN